MSTSDLLTRMYAMPSKALSQQRQTLMQKLHSMLDSPTLAITALSASYSIASDPISSSCSDPYLHRVYWLLRNNQGAYLAAICGTVLHWSDSADAVPAEYRFCSYQSVKTFWLQIRNWLTVQDEGLAIAPVDFYAHRNTPHLWCACND
jgi:hypothetical protein